MRILIDVLHPAHAHFFRSFHREMEARGHTLLVTAREKEMTTNLLERFGMEPEVISTQASRKIGLAVELMARSARLALVARRFRPDVLTGIMGPSIAPVGRLLGLPSVVFYDTEHALHTNVFVYPLAHTVCTPDCYTGRVWGRHVTYPGYHESAYLHPARFTPDPAPLAEFGLVPDEPYFLVRFVSWQAIHDVGHEGLSLEMKARIVERLEKRGRVVISSEGRTPPDLQDRVLQGPPEAIHHVLAFASGVVGESATMCSEAAVLGVPSVYVNPIRLGYLDEQEERYGLVRNVSPAQSDRVLSAVDELPWAEAGEGHGRLLREKIDVTEWMVRFFEDRVRGGRADHHSGP